MASIQKKGTACYCQFRYLGRRHTVTVGRVSAAEAEAFAGNVDYLLMRIRQKLLHVPPGVDIAEFVLHNGNPPAPAACSAPGARAQPAGPFTLRGLRDRYLAVRGDGSMEANSLSTARMHLTHFMKTLGPEFPAAALTLPDLQRHVTERARVRHRGKPLSPVTLRKEVPGLRAAWNWAALSGLVAGPFPGRGLVYPKVFRLAHDIHDKRLESDLSHPTKRKGNTFIRPTSFIRYAYFKTAKKLVRDALEELHLKWAAVSPADRPILLFAQPASIH